jgi:hypothetical protein
MIHRNQTSLRGMFELPMTATRSIEIPTIRFNQLNCIANFQRGKAAPSRRTPKRFARKPETSFNPSTLQRQRSHSCPLVFIRGYFLSAEIQTEFTESTKWILIRQPPDFSLCPKNCVISVSFMVSIFAEKSLVDN